MSRAVEVFEVLSVCADPTPIAQFSDIELVYELNRLDLVTITEAPSGNTVRRTALGDVLWNLHTRLGSQYFTAEAARGRGTRRR